MMSSIALSLPPQLVFPTLILLVAVANTLAYFSEVLNKNQAFRYGLGKENYNVTKLY